MSATITSAETGKPAVRGGVLPTITSRHLSFGWWSLFVFFTLGLILEGLHGVKASFYLDVSNHTRRLMWTLGHAHGALLGLVQIAFAVTINHAPLWDARQRALASVCLICAGILIPAGFLLGGAVIHAGDPGVGIVLVPLGAALLLLAGVLTARAVRSAAAGPRLPATAESPKRQGAKRR
jgi:hypothetical protein